MTLLDLGEFILAFAMLAITSWLVVQRRRRPDDPGLNALIPGAALVAFAVTVSLPVAPLEVADDVLDVIDFSDLAWIGIFAWFSVFFMLADQRRARHERTRRARRELLLAIVALGVVYTSFAIEPWEPWGKAVYYLGVDGYAMSAWSIGMVRGIRFYRELGARLPRAALMMVLAGFTLMAFGVDGISLFRGVLLFVAPDWDPDVLRVLYNSGRIPGQVIFAVGLGLAPLSSLVSRYRQQHGRRLRTRWHAAIRPLWQRLMLEFPFVMLPRATSNTDTAASRGFDRLCAEVSDGLAQLSLWTDLAAGDTSDPRSAAGLVATALDRRATASRHHEEAVPEDGPGTPLEPDFGPDWRGRAQWMAALSRELVARRAIEPIEEDMRASVRR